jgi:polyphosphate kinase
MATVFRQIHPFERHESAEFEPVSAAAGQPAFINRDLSLIEFFRRVLEEALDKEQPVLERLKFLAIVSSILDEFFMIRVSGLKESIGRRVEVSPDGYNRPELMAEIRKRVSDIVETQMRCLCEDVIPELARNGIVLLSYKELSAQERSAVDAYFKEHVYPTLTPQAVDPTHPFPYISGDSINLAFVVKPKLFNRVARAM